MKRGMRHATAGGQVPLILRSLSSSPGRLSWPRRVEETFSPTKSPNSLLHSVGGGERTPVRGRFSQSQVPSFSQETQKIKGGDVQYYEAVNLQKHVSARGGGSDQNRNRFFSIKDQCEKMGLKSGANNLGLGVAILLLLLAGMHQTGGHHL